MHYLECQARELRSYLAGGFGAGWHAQEARLRRRFLVIVIDSIIQSGCLSFCFRKLHKRKFGWKAVLVEDNPSLPYF